MTTKRQYSWNSWAICPSGLFPALVCTAIIVSVYLLQSFLNWLGGDATLAQRTQGFINGRTPPAHIQMELSQHSLTAGQLFQPPPFQDNTRLLLRASCGFRQCYHVVNYGTVRRGLRCFRDVLLCPAHDPDRHTFSECVKYFYEVLQILEYQGVVVWDWNDVPQHPRMHWDATIFIGGLPHRMEIDGPVHDLRDGDRMPEDVVKDQAVIETPGLSVLRLKHQDSITWAHTLLAYIHGRLQMHLDNVCGTAWYLPFQYPGHGPMLGYMHVM